jgi:methylation protein EvaC
MPIANGFLDECQFKDEYFFDLKTAFCEKCKTFQLVQQPRPEMMFHDHYAFFSSTSQAMIDHFGQMARSYLNDFNLNRANAFVIELGSNDGVMLKHFANIGIKHLGIEPSANVAEAARKNGVNTITKFFSKDVALEITEEYGKADLISAANVMCHIPDLHSVGDGVEILLKDDGVFVFEDPYLGDMIQKTSYDQIYDEHVYLFALQSVSNIFANHGLEVFRVSPQITHGGSMRYYLCRKGKRPIEESVNHQQQAERHLKLDSIETFVSFRNACEQHKRDFLNLLTGLKNKGKRVVGYAATSKSTTVLNYCGIEPKLIEYICDTTPIKQNKFSPGVHIPIKPYEYFKKDSPDYVVLFGWNHAKEILTKESAAGGGGGYKWITFVPEVKILTEAEIKSLTK